MDHPHDEKEDDGAAVGGVEISLSPTSQAKLERRFERAGVTTTTTTTTTELPPQPDTAGIPPEFLKQRAAREEAKRRRYRHVLYAMMCFCLVVGVSLALASALKNNNKDDDNNDTSTQRSSSLNNNNDINNGDLFEAEPITEAPQVEEEDPTVAPAAVDAGTITTTTESPPTADTAIVVVESNIRAIKSKYAYLEPVPFLFVYGNDVIPSNQDWIGIYPTSATDDLEALGQESAFLFPCNQLQVCDDETTPLTTVGQVVFEGQEGATWPLEPDDYQAFLLRGLQEPYQVLAASNTLTINPDFKVHTIAPALAAIEADLRQVMAEDPTMTAKFVRLGFHDCAGGCDGCVDLEFHDNDGLEIPLAVLDPIVEQHEDPTLGISRADIWALAAFTAADVSQARSPFKVDFGMQYIGRRNCEDRFEACFDQDGVERACNTTLGPFVPLPEPDITSEDLFHFFAETFSFTVQETVALMGAHTLGSLHREILGFPGPNGWVRDNLLLDNDYYRELVGGRSRDSDLEDMIEFAPDWFRFDIDNSDLPGIPDRRAWHAFPPAFDGSGIEEIIMLTADVSFVLREKEYY